MEIQPEVAFREVPRTDELENEIVEGIERLEEVYPQLVTCRVMVEDETPGRESGNEYRVRLEMSIPNKNVVVDQDHTEAGEFREVDQMIREAFEVGRKRLRKIKELQRRDVKTQELPPHGRIVRLLTDDTGARYGFLMDRDGREIYFHENALSDDLSWDELEIGDEVRFAAAEGDEGPQASTVAPLDPQAVGPTTGKSVPLGGTHEA